MSRRTQVEIAFHSDNGYGGGSLRQFIREHQAELDAGILSAMYRHDGNGGRGTIPDPAPRLNDRERREWVLNDEGLYRWARAEGVRI